MKKIRRGKKFVSALAALVLGAALTGCGGGSSVSSAETDNTTVDTAAEKTVTEAAGEEKKADVQELNLILAANVSTLDPNASSWVQENQIISSVQEPLLRTALDDNGNDVYVNAAAESYEVSDDGLVYTIHLRDNQWSDGTAVTAGDYVYAYVRELTPANGFGHAADYSYIKNGTKFYAGEITDPNELGIRAVDDKTLEITLEVPDLDALSKIAGSYPIREDAVESASSEYGTNAAEMLYSGPFTVTEWIADNQLVLQKNENYWDEENISLDKINFVYAAEASTQATLFESEQIDLVEYNDDYAAKWTSDAEAGTIQEVVQPRSMVRYLIFNQNGQSGLMGNENVRLALSLAIDRQEYLDTVFGGRYYPAWDFVPFPVTVNGESFNQKDSGTIKTLQETYDTNEKLQELLEKGLQEENYSYSTLKDVVIHFTDKAVNTQDQARIEYLRQTWEEKLGITVDTEVTADFTYMDGDYDVTNATWSSGTVHDALKNFGPGGIAKLTGFYEDEEVNGWFQEVSGVTSYDTYKDLYKKIENKLVSTGVVAPIYWGDTRYFIQNYVRGITFYNLSASFDITRAYIIEH